MSLEKRGYGNDTIESIDGERNQVRRFPHNDLGARGNKGAKQTFREIIGNALDERQNGYGNLFKVYTYNDGSVRVTDFGRGVPMDWHPVKEEYNWSLIYNLKYAGGKYNDKDEILNKIYNDPELRESFSAQNAGDYNLFGIGAHGVGSAVSQYTSDFFNVESKRDGYRYYKEFKDGYPTEDPLIKEPLENPEETGTSVHWRPNDEVFGGDGVIPAAWVRQECKDISVVQGVEIHFTEEGKETEIFKPSTLDAMIEDVIEPGNFTTNSRIRWEKVSGKARVVQNDIVIGKTKDGVSSKGVFFLNNIRMNDGLQRESIDQAIAEFFKGLKIPDYPGIKFKASDYEDSFSVVLSTYAVEPAFPGQSKDYLDTVEQNIYIGTNIYLTTYDTLSEAYARGDSWITDVIEGAVYQATYREEAKYRRQLANSVKAASKSKRTVHSDKFISCANYVKGDYDNVGIYFVEGDSAGGGVKKSRNPDTQALFYLKGKSLNAYKASVEDLLKNSEVRQIITIMGTGIELEDVLEDGDETFNLNDRKFNSLYMMTDGDIDGLHIQILLFTIIYKLAPKVIDAGMLNIIEAPLYVGYYQGKPHYFYTSEEVEEWVKQDPSRSKVEFKRKKGLGTMEDHEINESMMIEGQRRCINIQVDTNSIELAEALEIVFGNSARRRGLILRNLLEDSSTSDEFEEDITIQEELFKQLQEENDLEIEQVELIV